MTPTSAQTSATRPTAPGAGSAAEVHVVGGGALVAEVSRVAAALRPSSPSVCVVPRIPAPAPLAELTDARLSADIGAALDEVLAAVQRELAFVRGGRLVFVLPSGPLMAATGSAGAAAVTNGVLSMARTLAIELARDSVTVNVLALDTRLAAAAVGLAAALAEQLATLLGPGGQYITGQEIYLTAGSDLGRLRP
jgi:NAD(P)-dependent dehydrogenase (short-subunit alcohol dehydrogenase family)